MKIRILYFAALRDAVGRASDTLELDGERTTLAGVDNAFADIDRQRMALQHYVSAEREALVAQGDPWAGAFANLKRVRGAVNQTMADDDEPVADGDEVAFFPPVTGG